MMLVGLPDLVYGRVRRWLTIKVAEDLAVGKKAVLCKLKYGTAERKACSRTGSTVMQNTEREVAGGIPGDEVKS